jgi:molybdate transport system substrate-binding protein
LPEITLRLFIFSLFLLVSQSVFAQQAIVAVAANMKDAFGEINTAFKSEGNRDVRVVYGSSGNFTAQIMNGAPFNLLISADEHFPIELYRQGKSIDEGVVYAIGQLVIISKNSAGIRLSDSKTELIKAINKANKIAIAKPDLAPYGKAAIEYLKAEGLWNIAKDKLIYADNVGIATMYVVTGAADLGFTAISLAKSAEVSKETNFMLVDSKLYEPIKQRMVLMKGAPQEALSFYRFMQSAQAKSILQKYGYSTP